MQSAMQRLREVDWASVRRDGHTIFTKLIRTRDPCGREPSPGPPGPPGPPRPPGAPGPPGKQRLARCLSTRDLTSLGVGSCVGTGMYLVSGMVSRKFAGPGVVISFIIAAVASIFSGGCYAEFGVRVPNTTGSAYTYSYVAVGEFVAFVIGWNMVLEYLIGTSACARALSACFDSLCDGSISRYVAASLGTVFGKPPDLIACGISLLMTAVLVAGVRKSLLFNNLLNAVNFVVWVFLMAAGLFYVDFSNWTEHQGFLPYGWSGVFSGAATCFYAFIGFDIIATTGEEANDPKRSIPLAIVLSLGIILVAYVTSSMMLTLIVPYDQVDMESGLVQMFAHVRAPTCKCVVAAGALAGLTVSMFGSMFPMPRVIYAMANDGLIFKRLATISETTGTPALAAVCGGVAAALVALVTPLEVLVEMMSIGTLLAYTLVSSCVLVLRYQPNYSNLIELLPQSLRTPAAPEGTTPAHRETTFAARNKSQVTASNQPVITRRVTRSSPDSDDTMPGDDSEEFGRDDSFLVNANTENKFYGAVPGGSTGGQSGCGRLLAALSRRVRACSYLCPGLCPWVDLGPASDQSGMFVIKSTGLMFLLIILLDVLAAFGDPSGSTFTAVVMIGLALAIFIILLLISRKPQNRANLGYCAPGLPFVPATAVFVNIYLILNLSILTLVRFTLWMIIGLVVYFKYGIKNSKLERAGDEEAASPPTPSPLDRATLPPAAPPAPLADRNIFEGDGSSGLYGNLEFPDPLLAWPETELQAAPARSPPAYKQVESRYNAETNSTSSHAARAPPRAPPRASAVPELDSWGD